MKKGVELQRFFDKDAPEGKKGIVEKEWNYLIERRNRLGIKTKKRDSFFKTVEPGNEGIVPPFDMFGIALSGGGVRSATFALGFLKCLNEKSVFKHADYLSTVSGGGYTGAFIQKRLLELREDNRAFDDLFDPAEIEHLKNHGDYLRPGRGIRKIFEKFHFWAVNILLALVHLLWYGIFAFFLFFLLGSIGEMVGAKYLENLLAIFLPALGGVLVCYYFMHGLRLFKRALWPSKTLFYRMVIFSLMAGIVVSFCYGMDVLPGTTAGMEYGRWAECLKTLLVVSLTVLIGILLCYYVMYALGRLFERTLWSSKTLFYGMAIFSLVAAVSALLRYSIEISPGTSAGMAYGMAVLVLGFFANPNILSSHRYYRFRLKDAFLGGDTPMLHELKKWLAPYPLINTTLNVQADKRISGMKSCDYFLLSPLFCGSKLTRYLPTDSSEYRDMTLATAMTVSGAALNPEMGIRSSKIVAFFMTLLNLRLGYWVLNPMIFDDDFREKGNVSRKVAIWLAEKRIAFWPWYNLAELFGRMNLNRTRVNLSDGGHIENLGVFELLRRRCSLILSLDAGADPDYTFDDLKNLLVRARNELEIAIEFPEGEDPEAVIRPNLSTGFSRRHYAIGKMYELGAKKPFGCFVYVKASVTAQKKKLAEKDRKNAFYSYKNYHPAFPHEPTVDQFFDEKQWEAYFTLGGQIAETLLENFDAIPDVENLRAYFESIVEEKGEKVNV